MPIELSICICTFNRGDCIGETLESIVTQATDAVEITIVDGGSTDATEDVVRAWQARFPRIRYQRQKVNGGFDRDLVEAVDLGEGRYLWMYSDDDPMKPGAVARVLRELDRGYAFIFVNAEMRNRDLTRVLNARRLPVQHDRIYQPADTEELLSKAGEYLTFVGAIIVRRDVWQAREKTPWLGTMFVHTAVVFQAPLPGPALFIAEPQVTIRYGQALWTPRRFDVWMFLWPDLIWSFPFSDTARRAVVPREPWRKLHHLLIHRGMRAYGPEQYARIAPALRGPARWLSRLITIVPVRPLNLLLTMAATVIQRRPSTTLVDLRNSRRAR